VRILVGLVLLYWIARGALEGFVWASESRRSKNWVICDSTSTGRGVLDYHAWRLLECFSVLGMVFFSSMIPVMNFELLIGVWFLGIFIYERILNWVVFIRFFPNKKTYELMGVKFPAGIWLDMFYLVAGIMLVVWGLNVSV